MHPTPSIIVFTTASGAGYGLLFWLALLRPLDTLPDRPGFTTLVLTLALLLITVGLLASTAHLGRPERAWRALSQWRSSWLSREGIAALLTYPPALLFGYANVTGRHGLAELAGLLAAFGAAATVFCTGMIYASLKPIRQWHHPLVVPGYLLLAGFSGAALLAALAGSRAAALVALACGLGGLVLKLRYWRSIDSEPPRSTAETATGLGAIGRVRPLDPAHTQSNYLMREMGFRVARKHAAKLRRIALAAGFVVPVLCLVLALLLGRGAQALLLLAAAGALSGILIERWLLFAEATHTVMLYYGRPAA